MISGPERDRFLSLISEDCRPLTLGRRCRRRLFRLQLAVFRFLEKPSGWLAHLYHFAVFALITAVCILSAVAEQPSEKTTKTTENCISPLSTAQMFWLELGLAFYLLAEFLVRLWAVGANARFHGLRGRLVYLRRPTCLVDLLVLGASFFVLFIPRDEEKLLGSEEPAFEETKRQEYLLLGIGPLASSGIGVLALNKLRFLQIFRILHVDRQMNAFALLRRLVRRSSFELLSVYYIAFMVFLALAICVFTTEQWADEEQKNGEQEGKGKTFRNLGDSFWFSIVTVLTIGYGDIVPRGWLSKVAVCLLSYLGLSMFNAASGLVGVGMSLTLSGQRQQRQQSKVRHLAARLIQNWLRFHLVSDRQRFERIRLYRRLGARLQRVEENIGRGREMARLSVEKKAARKQSRLVRVLLQQSTRFASVERTVPVVVPAVGERMLPSPLISLQQMTAQMFFRQQQHIANIQVEQPEQQQQQEPEDFSDEERILDYYYNQQRSHSNSLLSNKSSSEEAAGGKSEAVKAAVGRRYQPILRMCYFLVFLGLREKFRRTRCPYGDMDAESELRDLEHQRVQKFKELEVRLETQIGTKPARSALETKNMGDFVKKRGESSGSWSSAADADNEETGLAILERMELCERKMAEIRRKADFIEHLAGLTLKCLQEKEL